MEGPPQGGNRQSWKPNSEGKPEINRRDDRGDIGRKNEIFKHGIKGIKKITGKYNTSKPLIEVKISCPCGLKWTWHDHASPIHGKGRKQREGLKNPDGLNLDKHIFVYVYKVHICIYMWRGGMRSRTKCFLSLTYFFFRKRKAKDVNSTHW